MNLTRLDGRTYNPDDLLKGSASLRLGAINDATPEGKRLLASARQILAEPVFPPLRIKLRVEPSEESWAAAQKVLDDKTGVCGFVLDRANVMETVRRLLDKGFTVRLPTEKIKFVGILGAPEGIALMEANHPEVPIHLAAVDERLNERGYIVPGLGDAGDRQFGTG